MCWSSVISSRLEGRRDKFVPSQLELGVLPGNSGTLLSFEVTLCVISVASLVPWHYKGDCSPDEHHDCDSQKLLVG